jgi:hypothetical protein
LNVSGAAWGLTTPEKGDWMANAIDSGYVVTLCGLRPADMLPYFLSIKDSIIDDSNYWQMLAAVWMSTEICSPYNKIWRDLFTAPRRNRHKLMKGADRKMWRTLVGKGAPKLIRVYRAMNESDDIITALSWTLNKNIALKLANGRKVVSFDIPKETVIAYFDRRKEQEVISMFEEVHIRGL